MNYNIIRNLIKKEKIIYEKKYNIMKSITIKILSIYLYI